MKFEKRNGYVSANGTTIINRGRTISAGARGCTQDEINDAFSCFDEPERPELPEGWVWFADGDGARKHGVCIVWPDGSVQCHQKVLQSRDVQDIAATQAAVLEHNQCKAAAKADRAGFACVNQITGDAVMFGTVKKAEAYRKRIGDHIEGPFELVKVRP